MQKYTKIPNEILEAMQSMSDIESRLTAVLVRETFGWHRKECRLTWEDMVHKTGMSRGSIAKAMVAVVERGFFLRTWKSNWVVNSSKNELSTVQEVDESSENELSESSENELFSVDESSNFEPPSISKEKEPILKKKKINAGASKPTHPVWELPGNLKTPEFEAAWIAWFKHRLENGRYLTQTSGETLLAQLSALGPERAVAAILYSLGRGWLNVYEPELAQNGNGANGRLQTRDEIIAEAVASAGGW
jgi:hypothetical protein